MEHIIGIDFGTTNSVASVIEQGNPSVIPSPEGGTRIPSVVAFLPDGEIVVGEIASRQSATNPVNTIFGVKRLMGRFYEEIMERGHNFPFKLGNKNGMVAIDIGGHLYLPEEITAHILHRIKVSAEEFLNGPVNQAVITVPAYFDDIQREATFHAAEMADLKVMRLINEPTAAALAYGMGKNTDEVIAVYDFGGGTFDLSILRVSEKTFEVLCSHGDTQLGGSDIDEILTNMILDEFAQKHEIDLTSNSAALHRVREAAEQAKCVLSGANMADISLPFLAYRDNEPLHYECKLSRSELENMIQHLVHRTLECTERALMEATLKPDDIKKVILVGGTTRIPLVQDAVADFFDLDPFKGVNPDEVVALGAATQAGIMKGELDEVVLLDVTPHSLGVEIRRNRTSRIIEKNSTIPIKAAKTFTTTQDDQDFVTIHVMQGEQQNASDNISLGKFTLSDIPLTRRGVPRIRVTFFMNADGVLEVSAEELSTGQSQSLTVAHSYLSDDEHQSRRKRRSRRRAGKTSVTKTSTRNIRDGLHSPERQNIMDDHLGDTGVRYSDTQTPAQQQQFEFVGDDSLENTPDSKLSDSSSDQSGGRRSARLTNPVNMSDSQQRVLSASAQQKPQTSESDTPDTHPGDDIDEEVKEPVNAPTFNSDTGKQAVKLASKKADDTQAIDLYKKVIPQFLSELESNTDHPEFYKSLIRMYVLTKDDKKAIELARRAALNPSISAEPKLAIIKSALKLDPDDYTLRHMAARCMIEIEHFDESFEVLERLILEHTSDRAIIDDLERAYKKSLEKEDRTQIRFKLVKVYLKKDNLDEAIEILNDLVKNSSYEQKALKILGLCYWQKNLHYLAWQKFKALALTEDLKDILFRLADDMETTGQYTNALQVYEWLSQEFPDDEDVLERKAHVDKILKSERDRLGAPQTSQEGKTFDRFKIIEELNRGSMGIIYKAYDNTLDEVVALKVLADYLCSDPKAVERFKREARAAKKLSHQYIVRIHEMYESDDQYAISMEYIEGTDLKKTLLEAKRLTSDFLLPYLIQMSHAMKYAHNLGVIHRDIKPANIMISGDEIKITDFGIAKILVGKDLTHTGTAIIGTPLYMAPEQIIGGKIDVRTDIYSLGIMLYELVQGRPPFYLGNVEYHHIHTPPPPLEEDIDPWMAKIIMKCIKKKPSERFQNVDEILDFLRSEQLLDVN